MNKSTRAPWFVGETLNGLPAIIGDGDSVVAYMPSEANGCTYKPNDARLIAAAPRLLEALINMEAEKSDYMRINKLGDPSREETNKQARAAIADATGSTK